MPGIVGLIGPGDATEKAARVERMTRSMSYETFFTWGLENQEPLFCHVGWVNHRGAFADCMPLWNGRGDICIVFVGEHFGTPSIAGVGESPDQGRKERASRLVEMYERTGLAFLRELNGIFNGVILDVRRGFVAIFNDRYGAMRLHVAEDGESVYFATEAKALLEVLPNRRLIDNRSLAEYVALGCVLQDRCMFSGIERMPGGSAWLFENGRLKEKTRYLRVDELESQQPLDEHAYVEAFRATWSRVLPRYFRGEQDVGLSMTGGIDSRLILAYAPAAPGTLQCYTFGSERRESADVRLAREVAKRCGQPHRVLTLGASFAARFSEFAEKCAYVSDATMDASGAIDVYVQELAREVAPVRLSGVNGGEIMRGLVAFKPREPADGTLSRDLAPELSRAVQTYWAERGSHPTTFVAFKQTPWYMATKFAIELSQINFRTPYLDNELVNLVYRVPMKLEGSAQPALELIANGRPGLASIETDRGVTWKAIPGAQAVRHLWQELTFKAEYALDYGMPPWLVRVNEGVSFLNLERLFLGRHKFHHFRRLYRHELAGYVRDVLLDPRSLDRAHVDRRGLERIVMQHTSGSANYTTEIHKLLTFELAYRRFIDVN